MKVIVYDLNTPGQKYDELSKAIKALGDWAHPLDSTWFIRTSLSNSQIYDRLKPYLDPNDSLLVFETNESTVIGQANTQVVDWMNRRQPVRNR
jgi:hypothetical protein